VSLNYTQGYSHPNTYKNGGYRDLYGRGGSGGTFSDRGIGHGGVGSGRGRSGGQFANFQCQIFLNMDTLLMFVISGLMLAFSHMSL